MVGYQSKTPENWKMLGATFIGCDGSEEMTLGELPVNCDETTMEPESGWYPGYDSINEFSSEGNCGKQFVYINEATAAGWTEAMGYTVVKGWYDILDVGEDMTTNYNELPIEFGKCVLANINSGSPDAGIVFSGQVKKDPTFTDVEAWVMVNNCSPKKLTLGQLKVNCDETTMEPSEGWYPGYDSVNEFSSEGNCGKQFVYINEATAAGWTEAMGYTVVKGWYDILDVGEDMSINYNNVELESAEGVLVNANSGSPDITVQIDSALAN